MAQIDGAAGEQMRGADRRQRDADRADREAGIGQADDMHGDGVGIGGKRLAAQRTAPGLVLPPGGAIGPPCAGAAGAGGVERGAAGELGEFGGAGGAVRQGERAEQVGLQGQRSIRRRSPGGGGQGPRASGMLRGHTLRARSCRIIGRWRDQRLRIGHHAEPRTSVLRPQSTLIGRNRFARCSRVRERRWRRSWKSTEWRTEPLLIGVDQAVCSSENKRLGRHHAGR